MRLRAQELKYAYAPTREGTKTEIHNEENTPFITVDFYTAAGDWCGGWDVLCTC